KNGSRPRLPSKVAPNSLSEGPEPLDPTLVIPVASDQNRMDRTMFLPTPRSTIAFSSSANSLESASSPRTALGNHVYRHGKDSCPEMRYCVSVTVISLLLLAAIMFLS